MCESSPTPLARLSHQCADCLQKSTSAPCTSCRELAYRAFCDGNEAAWDLLIVHLWPLILRRLYAAQPELAPAAAQALGYQALRSFRRQVAAIGDLATAFPNFPALL